MQLVWPCSEVPSQYVFCHNVSIALFITLREHYKCLHSLLHKILAVCWGCILKLFYAIILVSFPFFADLLSLHLITFVFCHSLAASECLS